MEKRPGTLLNALAFDTHAFVKRLTAAGMPEAQAEVLADEQARLVDERLATKADLREAELRLEARMETAKFDIIKWMFGTIGYQTVIILGAVVALAKAFH